MVSFIKQRVIDVNSLIHLCTTWSWKFQPNRIGNFCTVPQEHQNLKQERWYGIIAAEVWVPMLCYVFYVIIIVVKMIVKSFGLHFPICHDLALLHCLSGN